MRSVASSKRVGGVPRATKVMIGLMRGRRSLGEIVQGL